MKVDKRCFFYRGETRAGAVMESGLGAQILTAMEKHGVTSLRLCSDCGQKVKDLTRHKKEVHKKGKTVYSCQHCSYSCHRGYDLKRHKKTCRRYRTRRGSPVDNKTSTN